MYHNKTWHCVALKVCKSLYSTFHYRPLVLYGKWNSIMGSTCWPIQWLSPPYQSYPVQSGTVYFLYMWHLIKTKKKSHHFWSYLIFLFYILFMSFLGNCFLMCLCPIMYTCDCYLSRYIGDYVKEPGSKHAMCL